MATMGFQTVDPDLPLDMVRRAYAAGFFPMAEDATDPRLTWLNVDPRAIIPLDAVHVPRKLRKIVRQGRFTVTVDTAFPEVFAGCAERATTWINPPVRRAYLGLAAAGQAHSVECWKDGELVGGLYGLALGGVFFGESMFSRVSDASKVAFVHLVARLRAGGFRLLDCQMANHHTAQFGTVEIPQKEFLARLEAALPVAADWSADPSAELTRLVASERATAA